MKIRKLLMISTTAVALTSSTFSAEAASSYVSLFGGASFLGQPGLAGKSHTHTTTTLISLSSQSLETSFKTGFVVGGNYGIDWGSFRTEVELAYRENHSGKTGRLKTAYSYSLRSGTHVYGPYNITSFNGTVPTAISLKAFSLMANAWYDFHDFEESLGVTPYIGGGVGLAQVKIGGTTVANTLAGLRAVTLSEKNADVFAWQVGAGVSIPIRPHTSLFVDYRYFAADGAHLFLEPGFHGGDVNADFDSHTVLVGVRFGL